MMPAKKQQPLERAFVTAIIENVEDDTPRLVYADWLEENGDPDRAEFIRLQIELAGLEDQDRPIGTGKKPGSTPRERLLQKREGELLDLHRREWKSVLPKRAQEELLCEFRRGFVARMSVSAARFLRGGAALCRATPLEELQLTNHQGRTEPLADFPALARVRKLTLHDGLVFDEGAKLLLESPRLRNLTALDLDYRGMIGLPGAQALANSPALARLAVLKLSSNELGSAGARILVESPTLQGLTFLGLSANAIDEAGAMALAAKASECLRTLELSSNPLGDAGVAALAGSARLANLSNLCLGRTGVGSDGVRALSRSPHLTGLTFLNLSGNRIGPEGADLLAGSPTLGRLSTLQLMHCELGSGEAVLRARFGAALQCRG